MELEIKNAILLLEKIFLANRHVGKVPGYQDRIPGAGSQINKNNKTLRNVGIHFEGFKTDADSLYIFSLHNPTIQFVFARFTNDERDNVTSFVAAGNYNFYTRLHSRDVGE